MERFGRSAVGQLLELRQLWELRLMLLPAIVQSVLLRLLG
jgi:hypothetical protein